MVNLELEALKIAQKLVGDLADKGKVKDLENHLRKGLGILTESGIYAFFLYLLAKAASDTQKKEKFDPCRQILGAFLNALKNNEGLCAVLNLKKSEVPSLKENEEPEVSVKILQWVLKEVRDLKQVLLLRDFLLRLLTYGRYVAEARGKELEAKDGAAGGGGAVL